MRRPDRHRAAAVRDRRPEGRIHALEGLALVCLPRRASPAPHVCTSGPWTTRCGADARSSRSVDGADRDLHPLDSPGPGPLPAARARLRDAALHVSSSGRCGSTPIRTCTDATSSTYARPRRTRTASTSWIAPTRSRGSAGSSGRRASTSFRSCSTSSPARCRSSGRGRASTTRRKGSPSTTSSGSSSARHHGPLAGHGARAFDVQRGARHGRRVRPRLVARPRSPADPRDPVLSLPHASDHMTPSILRRELSCRAGPDRRRRPRLLGPEPRSQPQRARRRDLRWICDLDQSRLDTFGRHYPTVRATRDSRI